MSIHVMAARERLVKLRSSLTLSQANFAEIDLAINRLERAEKILHSVLDDESTGEAGLPGSTHQRIVQFLNEGV